MPRPVLTKLDFVRRYQAGEFGNRSPTWDCLDDWFDESPWLTQGELYHIRSKAIGGYGEYDLGYAKLPRRWKALAFGDTNDWKVYAEQRSDKFYISAMAPHEQGIIQGEICRTFRGLELYWTTALLPMRDAFKVYGGRTEIGLKAIMTLKKTMDPLSYEWVQYLLDAYEDHVIEFSTFGVNWGTIPNRNTVIWEIRRY